MHKRNMESGSLQEVNYTLPLRNSVEERIGVLFKEHAEVLLQDLNMNRLEVGLVDAPQPQFSGHKIRAVYNRNPYWYRELYTTYGTWRRDRTERSLYRIKEGIDLPTPPFSYDCIMREVIHDHLINGSPSLLGTKWDSNSEMRVYYNLDPF